MNPTHPFTLRRIVKPSAAAAGLVAGVILGALLGASAHAQMYRPGTTAPGGVPAQANITSITPAGTNTTVCWYGMQGWYTIEATTNISTGPWIPAGRVAASDFAWCATVPNPDPTNSYQFRLNQTNGYAGSGACSGCHGDKHFFGTAHASAFSVITDEPAQQSCLPCHTVGYGQPTGFVRSSTNAALMNVGCENCHGPAAWHKYSDHNLIRPAVSIDPEICGGCHNASSVPSSATFEEYEETPHAQVNDDVKYGFSSGVYYPDMLVVKGNNAAGSLNIVTNGTPGSTNCYGYYVTTNADLSLKTNYTTGIIHSGNGAGSGYTYDPGEDRAVGCGICHSAATRMAQLEDYENRLNGQTNALVFPAPVDSASWSAACATCHDPHGSNNVAQLRNPTWSSNYYTMATTADKRTVIVTNNINSPHPTYTTNIVFYSAAFANMYDPNIHICGQCHNNRGARWDGRSFGYTNTLTGQSVTTNGPGIAWGVQTNISFSRQPHHSPQYNILIGNVQPDYLAVSSHRHGTSISSSGSYNTNQCATCHVPVYAVNAATNYTGHTFELDTHNCTLSGCHGSVPNYASTMNSNSNSIYSAVAQLNAWATANGTNLFGAANATKYGVNGWEFTTPGDLASTNANVSNAGPSSGDQLKIPNGIKQARFNLYMAKNDGSYGVHNPTFVSALISDATTKISNVNNGATNSAYFAASATLGYAPFTPTFTPYGTGVTNYLWDFGGGNTSTLASPTFTYTIPGTNSVTLTVVAGGVTNSYTRTNYIRTYTQPVITFAANPLSGEAPMTVTFTNTSTSTNSVTAWRWTFNGVNVTATTPVTNYTFTTPGNYTVALRATTPVGSITVTSNAFVIGTTNPAYFVASATAGYVPFTNTFTCLGVGATNYSWSFGDGGTSTDANPTYVYNSRGTNTVTLTVGTAGGTKTWTRTNYVTACDLPVVSFAANPLSGPAPLSVTFTNTSVNTNSVSAWRWTFGTQTVTTNVPVYTYVFTNVTPTNYSIQLRATTAVGTVTTTNINYITVTP
jgi:PKD repeat protein